MFRRRFAAAMCIAVVLAVGIVFAQKPAAPVLPPVTIDVPGFPGYTVPILTTGAWPLTITMQANNPLGVGTYVAPAFPQKDGDEGFIVWADPDGCWSLSYYGKEDGAFPCPDFKDETYLEFTPGINLPNFVKETRGLAIASALGGRPTVVAYEDANPGDSIPGSNTGTYEVGPFVGDEPNGTPCGTEGGPRCDNYGYGASPSIPGLVILSDTGVGRVWDPSTFLSTSPKAARNLAGLVNSVSWVLNDCAGPKGCDWGRSGVTAHMNVPRGLFNPVVRLYIGHYANGVSSGRYYQIDGGSWASDDSLNLVNVLNAMVTTVRIFVVSGKAPDEISDNNGDGVVDVHDLPAGYKLLSPQTVIRFRSHHQVGGINPPQAELGIPFDFDGNGMDGVIAPGGSGDITPRPR